MIAGAALADDIQKLIRLCYLDAAQHGDPAGEESLRQHAGGGPGDEDLRARVGHLQQTGQGVIQDGHPGDDQQIGLGDALRRLWTASVAAGVRVRRSMTFGGCVQRASTMRSEVEA